MCMICRAHSRVQGLWFSKPSRYRWVVNFNLYLPCGILTVSITFNEISLLFYFPNLIAFGRRNNWMGCSLEKY